MVPKVLRGSRDGVLSYYPCFLQMETQTLLKSQQEEKLGLEALHYSPCGKKIRLPYNSAVLGFFAIHERIEMKNSKKFLIFFLFWKTRVRRSKKKGDSQQNGGENPPPGRLF